MLYRLSIFIRLLSDVHLCLNSSIYFISLSLCLIRKKACFFIHKSVSPSLSLQSSTLLHNCLHGSVEQPYACANLYLMLPGTLIFSYPLSMFCFFYPLQVSCLHCIRVIESEGARCMYARGTFKYKAYIYIAREIDW